MWKKGGDCKECPGDPPKKCFKGVENFLRRVAFNLGNSPSQTEVKIISCIPIDVTDLQQKINHLERQLEEACQPVASCYRMLAPPPRALAVHAAVTAPAHVGGAGPPPAAPADDCPQLTTPENSARRKSAVSLTVPVQQCQREPRSSCTSDTEPRKKNIFKRYRKPRNDSPLVYYAQTTSSPFTNYRKEIAARRELKRMDAKVDEPYVGSLLRKQYGPETLEVERWGGASSQSSAPVCRDVRAPACAPAPCARDADACSCCRGRFYDIDRDCRPILDNSLSTNMHRNVDSGNIFYNSVYYDIFPVKEKEQRETDKYKTWEQNFQFDDNCFRKNYRTDIESRPMFMNTKLASALRGANKKPRKLRKWRDSTPKRPSTNESTGNTIVECSDIYMKRSFSKKRKEKGDNKTVLLKDVECLTSNVNDTECQTESSKNMRPDVTETLEENQTETTLNQIKSILQSVLSHVKTNNLIKQTDSKEKKDAIVQKELQPNIPPVPVCSRLANIYTYSPFSMDPYAAAGCPPVVMPLHPAAPTTHFKCMNNFPVFTQHSTPPRQYAGCYNPRPQVNSQQIQTSANTLLPAEEKRSKQTENLIKDIYGAITLNIPESPTPNGNSNDARPRNISTNESGDQGDPVISNLMTSRQVGPRAPSDRAQSRDVSTAVSSPATSGTSSASTSDQQRAARGAGDQRSVRSAPRRPPRPACPACPARLAPRDSAASSASERRPRQQPDVIVDSESPSEDIESASDHTVVPTKPSKKDTKKPSIFKKMFGSVFGRRKKVKFSKVPSSIVAASSSDSDDYQTVYSQTVERPKRVTYAPAPAPRPPRAERHAPYMEQEYRRYWDEQLMFQRPQTKYSSERAPSRPRSVRSRPPGIYFHKCEARPTLIDRTSSDPEQAASPSRSRKNVSLKVSSRKMSWPKKHAPKIKCAEQWTRLMLDN